MQSGALVEQYSKIFSSQPELIARAPGRVNIIGEHIDYCGYGVFPIAIENAITILLGKNQKAEMNFRNIQSEKYHEFSCKALPASELTIEGVSWYNYLLCGIKGVLEHAPASTDILGMNILVSGTIPPGAGLSSSSALVCCAALAVNAALKCGLSKEDLAKICARSERYIGTEGGGMDQAISLLAVESKAMHIQFNPLRLESVELPKGVKFIVVNSYVESNKAVGNEFNTRVTECRVAAQVLSKLHGLEWREVRTLGQLQEKLQLSLSDMMKLVETKLHKEPYSREEVLGILETNNDEFVSLSLSAKTKASTEFVIYKRAKHVYSEADRVLLFSHVCRLGDVSQLGQLMTASHHSCRDDYECSCKELDRICDLSLKAGALGARLTGAGWGGCAVVLVMEELAEAVMKIIRENFFVGERAGKGEKGVFVTVPSAGATLIEFHAM